MVDGHLCREILLKPFIIVYEVMDETQGILELYLYGCLACLTVVEPCLGEPSYSGLVAIDTDQSRYVEALYVDVKGCQRIDELIVGDSFRLYFFFTSSSIPGRNMPCWIAI